MKGFTSSLEYGAEDSGRGTYWNDINTSLAPPVTGPSAPAILAINGDVRLKCYTFSGSNPTPDELSGSFEILHDYKEGTNIVPHIHWAPTTAGVGNVKWQLRYMWVNRLGTFSGGATIDVTEAAGGVAWVEHRSSLPAITGTGKEIGSRFVFNLFRDATDAADTYTDAAAVFDFGLHYEKDTLGSRGVTPK